MHNGYIDYTLTFGRYSKRKREMIKKPIKVDVTEEKDLINLNVKNSMFLGVRYIFDFSSDYFTLSKKDDLLKKKIKPFNYKTKDSLINEIKNNSFKENLIVNSNDNNSSFKNKKVIKQKFIIKVPKNVIIRLKATQSNITFNYDIKSYFTAHTFKGFLKFKKISSKESKLFITNGSFKAEEINGGSYNFKDVSENLIGTISNAKIASETSKIQIGEIGVNVDFTDFNSENYFYNFSNQFNQFKYNGDYSKLFFYDIKNNNYIMDVYGFNTVLNIKDVKTTFGTSKEKEMFKILKKKLKKNIPSSGTVDVKLKNGILNIK